MNSTVPENPEFGDGTKILAMVCLGLGSLLSGLLPAAISNRNLRRFPLTTSLMLCFGAGVLLATAMVHMLPDVRKMMPNNAEVYFCGGFFIVYFIDEFIHYFFGEAIQHSHGQSQPTPTQNGNVHQHNQHNHHSHQHHLHYGSNGESEPLIIGTNNASGGTESNCETAVREANDRICHTSHQEPCSQSMTGTFGLFVALSLHSLIEGIAIGVQNSSAKVLVLLGAVACHKYVMGFCLGLEFRSNPGSTFRTHFLGILTFSLGSVIGIGMGMAIIDVPTSWSSSMLPIIQALAGGTLFYVTVCEVMPREKARWHQSRSRRAAGLAQFLAVGIGFAVMTIINVFIGDED